MLCNLDIGAELDRTKQGECVVGRMTFETPMEVYRQTGKHMQTGSNIPPLRGPHFACLPEVSAEHSSELVHSSIQSTAWNRHETRQGFIHF